MGTKSVKVTEYDVHLKVQMAGGAKPDFENIIEHTIGEGVQVVSLRKRRKVVAVCGYCGNRWDSHEGDLRGYLDAKEEARVKAEKGEGGVG